MPLKKPQNAFTSACLAALLPGMGFAYLGQFKLALMALITPLVLTFLLFIIGFSSLVWQVFFLLLIIISQILSIVLSIKWTKTYARPNRPLATHGGLLGLLALLLSFSVEPLLLPLLKKTSHYTPVTCSTISMEPNLMSGDRYVLNRSHFKTSSPRIGELAAFEDPNNYKVWQLKRIVGLPGDTIEIRNGDLFCNGLQERPSYKINADLSRHAGRPGPAHMYNYGPITLEQDQLFCLGDNRPNSLDCRFWGPIRRSSLVGCPTYIYWSKDLSRIGVSSF